MVDCSARLGSHLYFFLVHEKRIEKNHRGVVHSLSIRFVIALQTTPSKISKAPVDAYRTII